MTTTPTLWKDLGQVNTNDSGPTGNFQFDPVVTGLANGNILVAYVDDSNSVDSSSGTDILGRLYDPEGNPLGDSFQLNSGRYVDDETDPAIAGLSDGGFVMVYEDIDANGTTLYWEKYDAGGSSIDSDVLASDPGGAENVADPRIAVFPDDSFVVVYTFFDGSNSFVKAKIVASDGTVGAEIDIRDHPDDPRQPDVAVLDDGNFVVVFVEDDGSDAKIEYSIYDTTGGLVRNLNIASPGTDNEDPQVVALKDSGFAVVWADESTFSDEQIYARVFNDSGDDLSGLIDVATDADDDAEPAVAPLDDGGFVVLYDQDVPEFIRGQRFDSLGGTVGSVFTLAGSGELVNTPEAALLADGRFVGAWQVFADATTGFDVLAQIWDPRDASIAGTSAADVLTGRQDGSTVRGLEGDDSIFGVDGTDTLYGGSGSDSVFGGSGDDRIVDDDLLSGDSFDGGSGQDTIDFGQDTFGVFVTIDLEAGIASFTGGQTDYLANFEHGVAGRDASLLGTSAGNRLFGSSTGDNYIAGRSGNDSLYGVGGYNTFYGGGNSDRIFGASLADTAFGGSLGDALYGQQGSDTLYGDSGFDRLFGGEGLDSLYGGDSNDSLFGNAGDDRAFGGSGFDRLDGLTGNDHLDGGQGADSLSGGSGQDGLYGGEGSDRLLGEAGSDSAFGGQDNDSLFGGDGTDSLYGGSDNDLLQSGTGFDRLFGGSGSDLLLTTFGNKYVYGGDGDDVHLPLGAQVQAYGGSGDDALAGDVGGDRLTGGSGVDTLQGFGGDDRLFVGSGEAQAGETLDGGSGSDTLLVLSGAQLVQSNDYVSVEHAILFGTSGADSMQGPDATDDNVVWGYGGNDDLRGGDGDDSIDGGEGHDALRGQQGDDALFGGLGRDTLLGAGGDDTQYGGSANDRLGGGSGADLLFGGEDSDLLNGGSGVDTAAGGAVNDTYVVDTAGDLVLESAGGGLADLVRSNALDFSLGTFVERGNLNFGIGEADLRGNAQDNTLLGNESANVLFAFSGTDTLNGRSGADRLTGGSGDDTFVVDTVGDEVRELNGQGTDLVRARVDFTLPGGSADAFLENLRLEGGALAGGGNELDNTLEGNGADNALRGFGGSDLVQGGDGDDTLFGGADPDRLQGDSGADTLYVGDGDILDGGSGGDWFRFNGNPTGSGGSGGPTIRDFDGVSLNAANGADRLVFASGLEVGTFAYIGGAAFSASGNSEARFAGTRQIQVDRDGDGSADVNFLLNGATAPDLLTASDFLWL